MYMMMTMICTFCSTEYPMFFEIFNVIHSMVSSVAAMACPPYASPLLQLVTEDSSAVVRRAQKCLGNSLVEFQLGSKNNQVWAGPSNS